MTQRQLDRVYVVVADAVPQHGAFEQRVSAGPNSLRSGIVPRSALRPGRQVAQSRLYCGIVRDPGTVRTSATKVTPELHSSFANAQLAVDLSRPSP